MIVPPIPVERYLTPDPDAGVPEGFTLVDDAILQGFPHVIALTPSVQLQLVIPHGVAASWTSAHPSAVVSRSDEERAPYRGSPVPVGDITHPPLRIVLRVDNRAVGSMPVAAGARRFLPEGGGPVRYEVVTLSWTILAGAVKGASASGSKIALAWRTAREAVDFFSTPPVSFKVIERLPLNDRMLSELGLTVAYKQNRFDVKKVVLR
jgi:hypothetical protein